jgi:hypothetical protein
MTMDIEHFIIFVHIFLAGRSKNLINITAFTLGLRLSNNENT